MKTIELTGKAKKQRYAGGNRIAVACRIDGENAHISATTMARLRAALRRKGFSDGTIVDVCGSTRSAVQS
jgi:hypothetical protein